ncbi:hypothetical protein [Pseudomonas sp. NA-150]|uniref:hypothetical protein n=1 Tax=Pseudomonas sp. NA-150 TaxID=3367525 RepID=UPI0037CB249D
MANSPQKTLRMEYTPENVLKFDPEVDPDCLDDVILCQLHRAGAVVDILLADITESSEFSVSINVVRDL